MLLAQVFCQEENQKEDQQDQKEDQQDQMQDQQDQKQDQQDQKQDQQDQKQVWVVVMGVLWVWLLRAWKPTQVVNRVGEMEG
jgi:anaerobic C4-dicarboxylate transporter